MNYPDLTIEQLEAENQRLSEARTNIRNQQKILCAVLEQKRAAKALDDDIQALQKKHDVKLQDIAPAAIDSGEAVIGLKATAN